MIELIHSLVCHQGWADATTLHSVRENAEASKDEFLRVKLHHIVMVQRLFLSLFLQRPFDMVNEMKVPADLDALEHLFQESSAAELGFVAGITEGALLRVIDMPYIKDSRPSLIEALMQVVMHSQGHRGQCLTRLRDLGAHPPNLDYILWLKERPEPRWR